MHRKATRVGVLHHRHRLLIKGDGGLPCGVSVKNVVVGEFLAVKLFGRAHAACAQDRGIESRLLVRVLSIAQIHELAETHREFRRKAGVVVRGQVAGYGGIVGGDVGKGLPRKLLSLR